MGSDALYVDIRLVNDKVKFKAASNLQPDKEITFDYVPPVGDGEGFLGLELLVTSFAGCVSTAFVFLLRRMGHAVLEYKMRATAIRRESPVMLDKIVAQISLGAAEIPAEDIDKAIQTASNISPVWLAIKSNVEVSVTYQAEL